MRVQTTKEYVIGIDEFREKFGIKETVKSLWYYDSDNHDRKEIFVEIVQE